MNGRIYIGNEFYYSELELVHDSEGSSSQSEGASVLETFIESWLDAVSSSSLFLSEFDGEAVAFLIEKITRVNTILDDGVSHFVAVERCVGPWLGNRPVSTFFVSSVALEQSETSSELNGVIVLDGLKSSVIEVQWSSTLAAGCEILCCVRDIGLINSLDPSVVKLLV